MRSQKKVGTTKWICRDWKNCKYALGGNTPFGIPCYQGMPYPNKHYIGPNGQPGPYRSTLRDNKKSDIAERCMGIPITPKMELEINVRML